MAAGTRDLFRSLVMGIWSWEIGAGTPGLDQEEKPPRRQRLLLKLQRFNLALKMWDTNPHTIPRTE